MRAWALPRAESGATASLANPIVSRGGVVGRLFGLCAALFGLGRMCVCAFHNVCGGVSVVACCLVADSVVLSVAVGAKLQTLRNCCTPAF